MAKTQPGIVTFKANDALLDAMKGMPNRSEFIRAAILSALDNVCPLCSGAGILTPQQQKHWDAFAADHEVAECQECHERHIVCLNGKKNGSARAHAPKEQTEA